IPLTEKYDNLLIVGTFSKSRSMAGARLGFGIGNKELIADLNLIKYSTNPYNINRLSAAAGIATLKNDDYTLNNCKIIAENREFTMAELKKLGFNLTKSAANFVFAKHPKIQGEDLYLKLKKKGILIRHFERKEICDYNRITIGTKEQMITLVNTIKEILEEEK
ncbi:MAG: aminotransferase class I/II-fold pyridoxal phosphate-dependent enzyme, partial [Clostridia bacterium]|nr:aminotransferase class I/II-fold pyridoxal phosphate-dependent enzyme [Clostridia bacterium]